MQNQIWAWSAVVLTLAVQAKSAFAAEKGIARGARVIAEFDTRAYGDFLLVPVKLAGEDRLFFLNTGAGVTILDSALKRHLGVQIGALANVPTSGGTVNLQLFRAPAASLGNLAFDAGMFVGCHDLNVIRRTMRMDVRGILGSDFLHNHVVQIDFDGARLRFLSDPEQDAGTEITILFSRSQQPYCPIFRRSRRQFPRGVFGGADRRAQWP